MKNTRIIITTFSTALLFIIYNTSFAQPPWINNSAEDMPKAFMKYEDRNGDGKVTKGEFKGPNSDFLFFDKNSDGVIELSEAPTLDNLPKSIRDGARDNGNGPSQGSSRNTAPKIPMGKVTLNGVEFTLYDKLKFFKWNELPSDVKYERMPIKEFTGPDGDTHYYEAVYVSSGNQNWFQSAYLAEDAGGYLASINSAEENAFVFDLVSDRKFFWFFPPYKSNQPANHYEIGIGPFLGGYQPEGSSEPAGGWMWLSGEKFEYTNWAVSLDDGVIDKDPRNNSQPNNSSNGQRIMGFGELNQPVPTWGDYSEDRGSYRTRKIVPYGFIIEYEKRP